MELRIANKYRVGCKIGSGSFGEVYVATTMTTGQQVAVKLEKVHSSNRQLLYESRLYRLFQGEVGIPKFYWYGMEGPYNVLVMELLGQSLEELLKSEDGWFSLKRVIHLANQMLARIEYIHSKNFIHRDIKPNNFLVGLNEKSDTVYLIDFGIAKQYRNSKTKQHIPYIEGKGLIGTARFASLNTSLGIEQARRDDIEGLFNVLIYFLKGSLPWQDITGKSNAEKYRKIKEKKLKTSVKSLCDELPHEFEVLMNYARGLKFEDRPDYSYIKRLLKELYVRMGFDQNLEKQDTLEQNTSNEYEEESQI